MRGGKEGGRGGGGEGVGGGGMSRDNLKETRHQDGIEAYYD